MDFAALFFTGVGSLRGFFLGESVEVSFLGLFFGEAVGLSSDLLLNILRDDGVWRARPPPLGVVFIHLGGSG